MKFSPRFWLMVSGILFIASSIWLIVDIGFEPLVGFISALLAFQQSQGTDTRKEYIEGSKLNEANIRRTLIERIQTDYVKNRLKNSLVDNIRAELGLSFTPEMVKNRRADVRGEQKAIRSDADVLDIFNEASGLLLIRGDAGAGKTTTLLRLLATLLEQAEADETAKIPIPFELSRWNGEALEIWLTNELVTRHKISRGLSEQWSRAENPQIIPLLDGLDEVSPERQPDCVDAINAYQQNDVKMLVCSRIDGYDELLQIHGRKLELSAAVELKLLTPEQIGQYLASIVVENAFAAPEDTNTLQKTKTSQVAKLAHLIQQDKLLQDLGSTPLFLNMMVLTYQDENALKTLATYIPTKTELLAAYAVNCFANKQAIIDERSDLKEAIEKRQFWRHWQDKRNAYWQIYSDEETKVHLTWLAEQMPGDKVFLIEGLQPDLLADEEQKRYHIWVKWAIRLAVGLAGGLAFRLARELNSERRHDAIETLETITWDWQAVKAGVWKRLLLGLFGLVGGVIFGLAAGLALGLAFSPVSGVVFGLAFGLAVSLYIFISETFKTGYIPGNLMLKSDPNQGMWATWQSAFFNGVINALAGGLAFGLTLGLAGGLVFGLVGELFGLAGGLLFGLASGLAVGFFERGGTDIIRHITLRSILMKNGTLPQTWNYASFLEYCCELRLLVRVGGGYKFIHRELQAYYAAQGDEGS